MDLGDSINIHLPDGRIVSLKYYDIRKIHGRIKLAFTAPDDVRIMRDKIDDAKGAADVVAK